MASAAFLAVCCPFGQVIGCIGPELAMPGQSSNQVGSVSSDRFVQVGLQPGELVRAASAGKFGDVHQLILSAARHLPILGRGAHGCRAAPQSAPGELGSSRGYTVDHQAIGGEGGAASLDVLERPVPRTRAASASERAVGIMASSRSNVAAEAACPPARNCVQARPQETAPGLAASRGRAPAGDLRRDGSRRHRN